MNEADLLFALGLPPEEAIKFLAAKGFKLTWDWHEMLSVAHAQDFTVAKVLRMDVLQDIREMVAKSLQEGITFRDFERELTPKLQAKGWWGEIVNPETGEVATITPWRLRTIFDTNLQTSYMAGRWKSQWEGCKERPYLQYLAVLDGKTRPAHRALHGKVFRIDDPIWKYIYPPNGFRCRCRVRALSEEDLKEMDPENGPKGLKVESSEGLLSFIEKPIGQGAGVEKVAVFQGKDAFGKEFFFSPDVGFNYNPGMAGWTPDLAKYDPEIARLF